MSIVSISRGSYSRGKEVAEKVAGKLGYTCLSRDEVLESLEEFNLPELKLQTIEDPPSFFKRLNRGKERYIAHVRAALLSRLRKDNVVYHGFSGQFFLRGVRHAFSARIIADFEDRVAIVIARDKVSDKEARRILTRNDAARRKWGLLLYGLDPEDPSLYDTVIHVGKLGTAAAADTICNLVTQGPFHATPESLASLNDLAIAAAVEALLVTMELDLQKLDVISVDGRVTVHLKETPRVHAGSLSDFASHYADDLQRRLQQRASSVPEMKTVEVKLVEP